MGKMRVVEVTEPVNTDVDVETAAATEEEVVAKKKKEIKLPAPIKLRTKNGGAIVHVATGADSYAKYYFTDYNTCDKPDVKEYRMKQVKLPIPLNGHKFTDVWKLFRYLCENNGYTAV